MVALLAFVSLAVDLGHVYVVRSELRQVQVRQHGTVFEVIKVHVEAVPQVVADMPHRRHFQIML